MRRLIMNGHGKTLLLIISLAFNLGACLAVAVQGRGQEEPSRPWGGRGRHGKWLAQKLDFSPEQAALLSASRDQLFEDLHGLERRHCDESRVLADLLTAPELDMEAVRLQVEKVATVRNEMQERMVQHLLSIREVLRPDQLEAFKEFAGKVLSRPERGRGHGRGPSRRGPPERGP